MRSPSPERARPSAPPRAWLIRITRDFSPEHLLRHHRLTRHELEMPAAGDLVESSLPELEGVGDDEILLLTELLPLAERQVVLLRYGLSLDSEQVAQVLGRSHEAVARLEQRGLASIRRRRRALAAREQPRSAVSPRRGAFRRAWFARTRSLIAPETKTAPATPAAAATLNEASFA